MPLLILFPVIEEIEPVEWVLLAIKRQPVCISLHPLLFATLFILLIQLELIRQLFKINIIAIPTLIYSKK